MVVEGNAGDLQSDDLVQEIFLALWRRPEQFDPDRGSLAGFLSVQAHTRSIDVARSETSRHKRELAQRARSPVSWSTTEDAVMFGLASEGLDRALADLPATEREVIVLAFYGGHTYREVADLLGLPEGTVKGRIRRGLRRLRGLLGDGAGAPVAAA